jgi:nucleotide-binding universal stress UspA family protein
MHAHKGYISKLVSKPSRGVIPLFKNILVPLDGSKHSVHALENAVQIAKKFDAKITLIHAYSVSLWLIGAPGIPQPTIAMPVGQILEAARNAGAAILANGEKRVKAEGIQVEKLLKEGHTVEEILKTAKEGKFDLIVVGARGLSTIKEILLGSVSHGVTSHAPCPVLVVK